MDGHQPPILDTDSTMITFMTCKGVRKWDVRTGDLLWKAELGSKTAPLIKELYAPMVLSEDRQVLYVPGGKGLYAINTLDGSQVWGKRPSLRGRVHQFAVLPDGIVTMGGADAHGEGGRPFITLLDAKSGESLWKDDYYYKLSRI